MYEDQMQQAKSYAMGATIRTVDNLSLTERMANIVDQLNGIRGRVDSVRSKLVILSPANSKLSGGIYPKEDEPMPTLPLSLDRASSAIGVISDLLSEIERAL